MSSQAVPIPTHAGTIALSMGGRSLHEMETWLADMRAFIKKVLVEKVDYGVVKGVDRPFLWKAGAEKLCLLYNLAPEFHAIDEDTIRDWGTNPPHIQYAFRCDLIHRGTGTKVGEGAGSASSWEKKHRYRDEWWSGGGSGPPDGEGWKKTPTGYVRKNINPDVSDIVNTLMKMARKRAQIDAVLRATATSEIFTQDEDAPREETEPVEPPPDAATTSKIARMIERIATAPRLDALGALAEEIAKDPTLARKNSKSYKNPVRAAYQKRHGDLKDAKPVETPAPVKDASPTSNPKPKDTEPVLPGTEREPGADEDEPEDPGPPA